MGSLIERARWISAATLALVLALGGRPLAAQSATSWIAGGGLSLPAGEFNSYANTGWSLTGAVERQLGAHPTGLRLGVGYAVNNDVTAIGFHETTQLSSVFGSVVYHFVGAHPHIYAMIGAGVFHRSFSSDDPDDIPIADNRFAVQIGEGVQFRIRSVRVFVEGKFITTLGPGPFQYFPLIAGIRFGGGDS